MKQSIINSTLVVAIAMVFAGCNVTSHTEKSAGVDFSTYKTFSWPSTGEAKKTDRADNDIVEIILKIR